MDYKPWADTSKAVGQAYVHASPARFRVGMAGRQSGKTLCGIAEICTDAMAYGGHIAWWVAPNYNVKERAWRGLLEFLPQQVIQKKNETERRIRLTNGSEIYVKSADAPDSLVSEGLHFAVCDEAGQWKETAWIQGIRPMFTATQGRALLIGTPRGKNWFHRLWLLGKGGDADYASFHWKTEDSPFSDPKDLAEARKNLPRDIYAQEYDADPMDNSGGVFKNVRARVLYSTPKADQFTVIGVDLARKGDFTAIIPMNTQRQALYVERSQEDWPVQKQRIAYQAFQNGFARLVVDDANVGDVVVQDLRAAGLMVEAVSTNSAVIKRSLIDNLRLAFESGTIAIPNDEVLLSELEAYSYEILPSGQVRYTAPDGQHDDTVVALALALWGQRAAMITTNQRSSYMGGGRGESYMRKSANGAS